MHMLHVYTHAAVCMSCDTPSVHHHVQFHTSTFLPDIDTVTAFPLPSPSPPSPFLKSWYMTYPMFATWALWQCMQDLQLDNPEAGHVLALFLTGLLWMKPWPSPSRLQCHPTCTTTPKVSMCFKAQVRSPLPSLCFCVSDCVMPTFWPHLCILAAQRIVE